MWLIICVVLIILPYSSTDRPCLKRKYPFSSVVCVCDSNYCDEISKIQKIPTGQYMMYTSNAAGLRFEKAIGTIQQSDSTPNAEPASWYEQPLNSVQEMLGIGSIKLKINRAARYQSIIGFGGAFTDSTGINLKSLSNQTLTHALKFSYFSENGIEFNIGRVPIGGTDFSTHGYAYNEHPEDDKNLSNFTLTKEDFQYKMPLIKRAMGLSTGEFYLYASTWSPPLWMKNVRNWHGKNALKKEYYQTYADYHIRFLEEYEKNGFKFWGISTTNEPTSGNYDFSSPNNLGWTPKTLTSWIAEHFGPTIKKSKYSYLKIISPDDVMISMLEWLNVLSSNKATWDYIDGIGAHYYFDNFINLVKVLSRVQELYPEKFFINTEATAGDNLWSLFSPSFGTWSRAEYLIKEIFLYLNLRSTGWIDWNLAVNTKGGPIWNGNPMDSFIVTMGDRDEFIKQPAYYGIGHFSKFLPRNSIRIGVQTKNKIQNVAFSRPDGGVSIIISNPSLVERKVTINDQERGFIHLTLSPRSVNSIVYW